MTVRRGRISKGNLFGLSFFATLVFLLSAGGSAYALHFELGEGIELDLDTTVRYTTALRIQGQNDDLLANINGDDGDRNFEKNSLIKNRFDLLTEADLNFGQVGPMYSLGIFARARGWYDFVYNQDNDNDSATSNNISVAPDKFTDDTEKWHGKKAEMLDYFLYAGMDIAGHDTTLRIGQQALNWGETLFLIGGVMSSQGPIDATGFNQPGAELKELFLPVEQISLQTSLTDNLSVEAYYQWEWQPYRLDAAGSYFSTVDMLDAGGESLIIVPGLFSARRIADEDPSDSGQWGVALRYLAEGFNGTEFGFYYINYHDQLPMLVAGDFIELAPGAFAPSTYHLAYAEDIHLYAASFGTVLGNTNISGEVTYRENVPVTIAGPLPSYRRGEIMHYSLSAIHLFGPNSFTDGMSLTAEVGADQVLDYSDDLAKDKFAWGYSFTLKPTWKSVLPGLDINLPISLTQGVNGTSALGASFIEGKHKLGVTLDFLYQSKYQAQLGYVCYFGASNNTGDRDYVSLNLKYAF
ncbi:MAG: DUF1302 domain-containing protein [Desulfuromusa sp.]|nr:DUF1302 domain-containing protein [Desulfuromusa sp.]